jgi:polyhydroxybutyrate depolymerase
MRWFMSLVLCAAGLAAGSCGSALRSVGAPGVSGVAPTRAALAGPEAPPAGDLQATVRAAGERTLIPPGAVLRSIESGGLTRRYWYVRPATAKAPAPAVFVLHGGASADGRVTFRYGFQNLAARDGLITVHPSGYGEGWNDGRGTAYLVGRGGADDVGFFRDMIDQLVAEGSVDPRRIFVTGGSNGGMMTQRLVCELADRIAGAAAFVAWLPAPLEQRCRPERPIPLLLMGGTADRLMPFAGGRVAPMSGDDRGLVLSAQQTFDFWRTRNSCAGEVAREDLPDADPGDGARVYRLAGAGCAAPVELYVVDGGGHRLPGEGPRAYADAGMSALSGVSSRDIDGAAVVWDFLVARAR